MCLKRFAKLSAAILHQCEHQLVGLASIKPKYAYGLLHRTQGHDQTGMGPVFWTSACTAQPYDLSACTAQPYDLPARAAQPYDLLTPDCSCTSADISMCGLVIDRQ